MKHFDYSEELFNILNEIVADHYPHILKLAKEFYSTDHKDDFFNQFSVGKYDLLSLQNLMQYSAIKLLLNNIINNLEWVYNYKSSNNTKSFNIIEPVLTSHPTEPFSIDMLNEIRKLHNHLDLNYPKFDLNYVKSAFLNLLNTNIVPLRKFTASEEVKANLPYLFNIYTNLPKLFSEKIICKPRSWAGGDADGNDKITTQTMLDAINIQSEAVINWHISQIDEMIYFATPSFMDSLEQIKLSLKQSIGDIYNLEQNFQHFLNEFKSLISKNITLDNTLQQKINDFKLLLDTFGFHLAPIDIRQNARVYDQVYLELSKLIGQNITPSALLQNQQIQNYIKEQFVEKRFFHTSPTLFKELERIETISLFPNIFQNLIISDTNSVEDMLKPYALCQILGTQPSIVPLFETKEALSNAMTIIKHWVENQYYNSPVNQIKIMLGYSDSEKESGIFVLPLISKIAQDIKNYLESQKIPYSIFHGNGLDLARGGPTILEKEQTLQGNQKRYFLSTSNSLLKYFQQVSNACNKAADNLLDEAISYCEKSINKFQELFSGQNLNLMEQFLSISSPYWLFVKPNNFSSRPSVRKENSSENHPLYFWLNNIPPGDKVLQGIRAISQVNTIEGTFFNFNLWYGFKEFLTSINAASLEYLLNTSYVTYDLITKALIGLELTDFNIFNQFCANQSNNKIISELKQYYLDLLHITAQFDLPLPDQIKSDLLTKKELVEPIKWFMSFTCKNLNFSMASTQQKNLKSIFKSDLYDDKYLDLIAQIFGAAYCGFTEYRTAPYSLLTKMVNGSNSMISCVSLQYS